MKILMLSATFPYPPGRGGTQVRTFNLLKYLSQQHSITLATLRSHDVTEVEIEQLRHYVQDLAIFPRPQVAVGWGWGGKVQRFSRFLLEGRPPSVISIYSPAMQNWVDEFVAGGKCDAITCEHSVNEIYVRPEWRKRLGTVVNIHSSVYGSCRQILETGTSEKPLRDRLNLPLLARYEKYYCSKFSRIVVTTEEDRQQLQKFVLPLKNEDRGEGRNGNRERGIYDFFNSQVQSPLYPSSQSLPIQVIPNGVDLAKFPYRQVDPGGHRLIFIGAMDNLANIDAVRFLSLDILPALQQRYPDATLTIVGSKPVAEVLALRSHSGITVMGQVPSMAEYLHQATVCAVPMRIGLGIKNKTLEAMAAGTPVVASDRGLEGLAVDGEGSPLRALRGNQLEEYVEAISRLFEDRQLREELSQNARSLIETEYTWEIIGQRYEQVLKDCFTPSTTKLCQ
ncbi:glycosyltransferase family 4 protein [Kamptonema animale CS-326]|jgi:glycosyltransferase involved in cell wall biosynthesis|uniref:glycosyltransferase family 4 protein n=1 Tax=Kamptonema animale TaxID=92934 RepID=UPI00232E92F2|nr:glycosyltransferase family 4 protein [Kamptonema animale]MDB9510235.1 glycosyltransferase family 4 protein [Kamptonema animale CS-326]